MNKTVITVTDVGKTIFSMIINGFLIEINTNQTDHDISANITQTVILHSAVTGMAGTVTNADILPLIVDPLSYYILAKS
jgi:hypothetical protein